MENFLPSDLLEFILNRDKYIFISDFTGWGEEAKVNGFVLESVNEGNFLRSETTGNAFGIQCTSIRRGNHLKAQLRCHYRDTCKVDVVKDVTLGDLFPEHDVVIVTNNENLVRFAPVLKRRSDVILYLAALQDFCRKSALLKENCDWRFEGDMIDLVVFLYQNNPDKIEDRSVYDRL